ncbi:MAG: UvrD-helicase domain-containing protein [Tepidisphaerales bacterium]
MAAGQVNRFTDSQTRAIAARGHGVLVSAAAGSGKTATLSERVARLIADERAVVDQFIVLTFTDNAASEMRLRIEKRLTRLAQDRPADTHLLTQVSQIGQLAVSTVHSYCSKLIRQHFSELAIDPAFAVLDESAAAMLEQETLETVLREGFAGDRSGGVPGFERLLADYADNDLQRLGGLVLQLHHFLASLPDRQAWLSGALAPLREAVETPGSCALRGEVLELSRQWLDELEQEAQLLCRLGDLVGVAVRRHVENDLLPVIRRWRTDLQKPAAGERLWQFDVPLTFPRSPPIRTPIDPDLPSLGWLGLQHEESPLHNGTRELLKQFKNKLKTGPIPDGLAALGDRPSWCAAAASGLEAATALLTLAGRFGFSYTQAKRAQSALDFSDLEHLALRLLQTPDGQPSAIAHRIAREHPYVLIDECQDINPVQDRLIELLSGEAWLGPSGSQLFCVGDLKQSIYRFRLAAPELFEARRERYSSPGATSEIITLSESFRTRPALLDAINGLFSRLMVGGRTEIDYDAGHGFKPGTDPPPSSFPGRPIEMHILPTRSRVRTGGVNAEENDDDAADDNGNEWDELDEFEREAQVIAYRIRQMVAPEDGSSPAVIADPAAPGGLRPVRYGDIAVLLRAATVKSAQAAAIFRAHGIPTRADNRGGLLDLQEVQDLLAVLTLLEDGGDEPALLTYLRSPLAGVPDVDDHLATARLEHPDLSLAEAIGLHASVCVPLRQAMSRLAGWRELAARRPVSDVLSRVCRDTLYPEYAAGLTDGALRRAGILELCRLADQFSDARLAHDGPTAAAFVRYMRTVDEASELAQPTPPPQSDDAVVLLTIHKAKGLEFPIVFVPNLGRSMLKQGLKDAVLFGRDERLALQAVDRELRMRYPSPAWTVARWRRRWRAVAEELRLLYVALTRAREHVVLVGSASEKALTCLWSRSQALADQPRLPETLVMSASQALDWVVTAAAHAEQFGERIVSVRTWSEADLRDLSTGTAQKRAGVLRAIRAWEPLTEREAAVTAEASAAVKAVIEQLDARYPHPQAVGRVAAVSVTQATHAPLDGEGQPLAARLGGWQDDGAPPPGSPILGSPPSDRPVSDSPASGAPVSGTSASGGPAAAATAPLKWSRRLSGQALELSATDRGTATHIALEHYDFRIDPTDAAVQAHLDELRRRHILTDLEVAAIERPAFRFLADSELGPLLRGESGALHKELPIYLAGGPNDPDAATAQGLDRQMVRGRIDLLVETAHGPVVIDYKTDHVWGERLEQRIRLYRGQVEVYRRAVEAITGRAAAGVYLAFVHARARRIVRF